MAYIFSSVLPSGDFQKLNTVWQKWSRTWAGLTLNLEVPFSAQFCLGRWKFGIIGLAPSQHGGTSNLKSTQPMSSTTFATLYLVEPRWQTGYIRIRHSSTHSNPLNSTTCSTISPTPGSGPPSPGTTAAIMDSPTISILARDPPPDLGLTLLRIGLQRYVWGDRYRVPILYWEDTCEVVECMKKCKLHTQRHCT